MNSHSTLSAESLLSRYSLRNTEQRRQVLEVFFKANFALSHGLIEQSLKPSIDRVTLYRTLKAFVEAGILHTIPDEQATVKYALCSSTCETKTHNHDHIHFTCESCSETFCMDEMVALPKNLPRGFKMKAVKMIVEGTCKACQAKP